MSSIDRLPNTVTEETVTQSSQSNHVPAHLEQVLESHGQGIEALGQGVRALFQQSELLHEHGKILEAHSQALKVLLDQSLRLAPYYSSERPALESAAQEAGLLDINKALIDLSSNQAAQSKSLLEHFAIFEIHSKALEAHNLAITTFFASHESIAHQLTVIPHLLSLIFDLQIELESEFNFRPGTNDRTIFRSINYSKYNEYRLPAKFKADDVIIDIGSHIGSFTYACLRRGAGKIHCYEPFAENMRLLQLNLNPFGSRVELHQQAVWRSDGEEANLAYKADEIATNKGLGVVGDGWVGEPVKSIGLDQILENIPRVRLLKVDCDGSEYCVLLTSRLLVRAEAICLEYEVMNSVSSIRGMPGYDKLDGSVLEHYLQKQGFNTENRPTADPKIGFIFATRQDIGDLLWE